MNFEQNNQVGKKSSKKCFVISPIGEEGSNTRQRSDELFEFILKPAVEGLGYEIIRGDQILEPGIVNNQVLKNLVESDIVIADLTEKNGNVFYELAVRHMVNKPFIHIMEREDPIPFDLAGTRIIRFKLDLTGARDAKEELEAYIKSAQREDFVIDNPISPILERLVFQNPSKQPSLDELDVDLRTKFDDLTDSMKEEINKKFQELTVQLGVTAKIDPHKEIVVNEETKANIDALSSIDKSLENIRSIVSGSKPSSDVDSVLSRANLLYYDRKYSDAMILFDQVLQVNPNHVDAKINKGWCLLGLGHVDEPISIATEIIKIDNLNIQAFELLGTAYISKGADQEALDTIENLYKLDPLNELALANKGIVLANLQRYKEAIPPLENALKNSPDDIQLLERLAESLREDNKQEEAENINKKIIKLLPNPIQFFDLWTVGNAQANLGNNDVALKLYDKALEFQPNSLPLLNAKGTILYALDRFEEALELFEKCSKNEPKSIMYLENTAQALMKLKKYRESIDVYDKILEFDPSIESARLAKAGIEKLI